MTSLRAKSFFAAGSIFLLALTGCASAAPDTTASEKPATEASEAPATTDESNILSDERLSEIFTELDFVPGEYDTTKAMFESVYPNVTLSSACQTLLGVGFEDSAEVQEGVLQFGTSVDRTLTAVVANLADAKQASFVRGMLDPYAFESCIDDPALTYGGEPIDAQIEVSDSAVTGADEADSVRLDATVQGSSVSVIGQVAQVDNNLILVVGWDPSTNERNSPLATQMFVDALTGKR